MPSTIDIIMLACAIAPSSHALVNPAGSTDKLADEAVDKLFDRAVQEGSPRRTNLENSTLQKGSLPVLLGDMGKAGPGGLGGFQFPQGAGIAMGVAAMAASHAVAVVDPGEVGVVTTLGKMEKKPLLSGFNVILPISKMTKVSVKTQKVDEKNFVPTKEGLTVELDAALLYHLDPTKVTGLFTTVGANYQDSVVIPQLRSSVRGLTSEQEAKALYTSGRGEIQRRLKDELTEVLARRGIIVEDVLLKAIKLPPQLVQAIELKAQADQEAQRMEFVLQKEEQEAARKKIEANGIADYQTIVSKGVSDKLLQWKGIEATVKLAQSPNSKVVVMGNGKHSLPVVLIGGS